MKSNMQMILELQAYWENHFKKTIKRGFVTSETVLFVKTVLELEKRDRLNLQNLRDMVVIYFSGIADRTIEEKNFDSYILYNDCSSALTHIIDGFLMELEKGVNNG